MAHDKHTLHVSHYKGSPNYRASVAPEDRSWILLIDANGSPELYCDIPTMGENGEWVHSYEPAGDKITAITRA